ncbi:MAG: DsbA family protein [Arachnia sp.]
MANSSGLSRRAALRQQQELEARRKRNNRIIATSLVVIAVVVITVVAIVIIQTLGKQQEVAANQQTPPNATATDGIAAKSAGEVAPEDAPHVVVYQDYQCPGCAAYEQTFGSALMELVDNGDISVEFVTAHFLDDALKNDSSERAAMAAAAADELGYYREFHSTVFANQPPEGVGYTDQQLREDLPAEAGITGDDLTAFQELYDSRVFADFVAAQDSAFTSSGVTSTPTYTVDGTVLKFFDDQSQPVIDPTAEDLLRAIKETAQES